MKALCWHGKHHVSVDTVPDPTICAPTDAIIKISSTAICGTDLHVYNGIMSGMEKGQILGHEFMGEVVEVGSEVKKLKIGDRVVVPSVIACGKCEFCRRELYSLCEVGNPQAEEAKKQMSQATAGVFGMPKIHGNYHGGQAEYVRVPYADVGPIKIPDGLADEQVLFLSDIFPTGYMAAENCDIKDGDTVAVWGCGPVGQMAIQSAWLFGAERVIAIDHVPERLAMAGKIGNAETIDFCKVDVFERLMALTNGQGPNKCIDAVGTEAHSGCSFDAVKDKIKQTLYLTNDRAHALREAIYCCKKGGTVSVPGVYTGSIDSFPFGEIINKNLTIRSGNTHMQRYSNLLLDKILKGVIDTSFVVTHQMKLAEGAKAYDMFSNKKDNCVKVVMSV